MKYEKVINLLHDTTNQPSKFRTRNCVETNKNHDKHIMLIVTLVIIINLFHYSNAYIHVKSTITIRNTAAAAAAPVNNTNKKVTFKNYAPFTNCISETIHKQMMFKILI